MKALTVRKPISMTTTSLTSGTLATRIAKSQRLHVVRVAASAASGWASVEHQVEAGVFQTSGLDVRTTNVRDAAAAMAALADGVADIAVTDVLRVLQARARNIPAQFIAIAAEIGDAYVALAPVIDAAGYAMARFARTLRAKAGASYVAPRDLQALIDRFAAEKQIDAAFPAQELISRVAAMSGVR